jgi:hypothetical protein
MLAGGTSLAAQYRMQSSWILAEEGRAQQVFVGAKVLAGVDIAFGNLGTMPYVKPEDAAHTYDFNDGYIDLQREDAQFTSSFAFNFANAVEGPDGNVESFSLTRYRSSSTGAQHEGSSDFSVGWELGSRYDMWRLSNRLVVGFTLAGGFTPLSQDYSATVEGDLFRQQVSVPLSGPRLPHQDSGNYRGGILGGSYIKISDLVFDPDSEERVTQVLPDGSIVDVPSTVTGNYKLLGGLGTVRMGAHLDYQLGERLFLHAGIGFSMSYLSVDFTVDQSLISSTLSEPYRVVSSLSDGEWLPGAYAELNLLYRLNQRTSFYAGAQKHLIKDFKQRSVDDVQLDVRLGQPTQFQAGLEFGF